MDFVVHKYYTVLNEESKTDLANDVGLGTTISSVNYVDSLGTQSSMNSSLNRRLTSKCGNYENLLSHFFDKNFVKVTFFTK